MEEYIQAKSIDWSRVTQLLNTDQIEEAVTSGEYLGFCVGCGAEHNEVEPDAERRSCESCREKMVFGAEQIGLYLFF